MADFREMTGCLECVSRPWTGRRPWHFISLCKLLVPWDLPGHGMAGHRSLLGGTGTRYPGGAGGGDGGIVALRMNHSGLWAVPMNAAFGFARGYLLRQS